jgi:hypothetical protein
MTQAQFISRVKNDEPTVLVDEWLSGTRVPACRTVQDYDQFKTEVRSRFPRCTDVYIVGSSNWGYSLNPNKAFRAFGPHSDVDVAAVSDNHFHEAWDSLRDFHRRRFYTLTFEKRTSLRRNGENVYSGFISPEWIPEFGHSLRYAFLSALQALSTPLIGSKPVRMYFFRSYVEIVDYYKRGVIAARGFS